MKEYRKLLVEVRYAKTLDFPTLKIQTDAKESCKRRVEKNERNSCNLDAHVQENCKRRKKREQKIERSRGPVFFLIPTPKLIY